MFQKEKKTQSEASRICKNKGSELASIRDKQDNDFIMSEFLSLKTTPVILESSLNLEVLGIG